MAKVWRSLASTISTVFPVRIFLSYSILNFSSQQLEESMQLLIPQTRWVQVKKKFEKNPYTSQPNLSFYKYRDDMMLPAPRETSFKRDTASLARSNWKNRRCFKSVEVWHSFFPLHPERDVLCDFSAPNKKQRGFTWRKVSVNNCTFWMDEVFKQSFCINLFRDAHRGHVASRSVFVTTN